VPEQGALVVGEALVDVVVHPEGGRSEHPGGSPANVALGLARLHRPVGLLTWLGADQLGGRVRAHLSTDGVRILDGDRVATHTATALARLDAAGVAEYVFDLEWDLPNRWSGDDQAPLVMHSGSIAATLQPGADSVAALARRLRSTSTITYDPNVRPQIMGSPGLVRGPIERFVALADVVKVSDEDLAWLYPTESVADVAARWAVAGPAIVVVTQGGDGARALTSLGIDLQVPAVAVDVVDTVGAGDSFMAGLIDGLWSAHLLGAEQREVLRAVDGPTLEQVLRRCVQIGAITVSRAGANPPFLEELPDSQGAGLGSRATPDRIAGAGPVPAGDPGARP